MPTAWRIVKRKHESTAFNGEGAALFGGRWNSIGTRMVYLAQSVSLASLEMLVHLDNSNLRLTYSLFSVEFDISLIEPLDHSVLPINWRTSPTPPEVQLIGDDWVKRGSSAVLEVPSVIVPLENNYLINPLHAQFSKLVISGPLKHEFDPRLIR
jgi:RES domain-containing protein